jgi:hypothetical protein
VTRVAVGLVISLALTACATGGRSSELDPEILEVQAVVLDYVLNDTRAYLREVKIDEVCVVAAVRSRVFGVRQWAGKRGGEGEWAAEILSDRLAVEGWSVIPVQACELEGEQWVSRETGAEAVIASAASMTWEEDDLVFVDAGVALNLDEQFRYKCTVVRTELSWAVEECSRSDAEAGTSPGRLGIE